jgi:hypothetical protein
MAGGRPPGPRKSQVNHLAVTMARLQGESHGRMLGRIDERTAITKWLKWQVGTPKEIAIRISLGEHNRDEENS